MKQKKHKYAKAHMSYKRKPQHGAGFFDGINDFLKSTKILSGISSVLAPIAGGIAGTFLAGGPGVGTAIGTAVGSSATEGLKSLGYGQHSTKRRQRGQISSTGLSGL